MTTATMTPLQFGFGLTTTPTSEVVMRSHTIIGTESLQIYKCPAQQNELSVDDMFAQLELSDPRAAAATEVGTKWVAQTFFSDHPKTLAMLRLRAGLSQRELGKRLGVSQPQIAKWERDSANLQIKTIEGLAKALSVNLTELFSVLICKKNEVRDEY